MKYNEYIKRLEDDNKRLLRQNSILETTGLVNRTIILEDQNILLRKCIWSMSRYLKDQKDKINELQDNNIFKRVDDYSITLADSTKGDLANGNITPKMFESIIANEINGEISSTKVKVNKFISNQNNTIQLMTDIIKECKNKVDKVK